MKNFCLIFLSILIVSCGKKSNSSNSNLEGTSFALNSERVLLSLVFKDQFITCHNYHEDQELICWNKSDKFPIFMNLNDSGAKKVLKISPQEEFTLTVNDLISIERVQIESWDACNQAELMKGCFHFSQQT